MFFVLFLFLFLFLFYFILLCSRFILVLFLFPLPRLIKWSSDRHRLPPLHDWGQRLFGSVLQRRRMGNVHRLCHFSTWSALCRYRRRRRSYFPTLQHRKCIFSVWLVCWLIWSIFAGWLVIKKKSFTLRNCELCISKNADIILPNLCCFVLFRSFGWLIDWLIDFDLICFRVTLIEKRKVY